MVTHYFTAEKGVWKGCRRASSGFSHSATHKFCKRLSIRREEEEGGTKGNGMKRKEQKGERREERKEMDGEKRE